MFKIYKKTTCTYHPGYYSEGYVKIDGTNRTKDTTMDDPVKDFIFKVGENPSLKQIREKCETICINNKDCKGFSVQNEGRRECKF